MSFKCNISDCSYLESNVFMIFYIKRIFTFQLKKNIYIFLKIFYFTNCITIIVILNN